jgi:hypothetical protein
MNLTDDSGRPGQYGSEEKYDGQIVSNGQYQSCGQG